MFRFCWLLELSSPVSVLAWWNQANGFTMVVQWVVLGLREQSQWHLLKTTWWELSTLLSTPIHRRTSPTFSMVWLSCRCLIIRRNGSLEDAMLLVMGQKWSRKRQKPYFRGLPIKDIPRPKKSSCVCHPIKKETRPVVWRLLKWQCDEIYIVGRWVLITNR